MALDPKTVEILGGVSTATLTTVLLKKGLRNVWMRGAMPIRSGQGRLVGPAFTLRFVPAREDLATPASWGDKPAVSWSGSGVRRRDGRSSIWSIGMSSTSRRRSTPPAPRLPGSWWRLA